MQIEFIRGLSFLLSYFAVSAVTALLIRKRHELPKELFRKTLHMILLGSVLVLTYGFQTWWVSALAVVVFMLLVYPFLKVSEKIRGYSELLIERKRGEIRKSFLTVFGMFLILITISWGLLGEKYLVLAPVFAWGLGDAAAALVGKRFGRRYFSGKLADNRKTLEGFAAMFVVSFFAVLTVLVLSRPVVPVGYVTAAAITAAVTALVELYTKNGMDTLTCPLAAAAILTVLVHL